MGWKAAFLGMMKGSPPPRPSPSSAKCSLFTTPVP